MGYELVEVTDPADWDAYHAIRRQELFEARGRFGIYDPNYPGERLPGMHPYLLKLDGRPLGTTRLDIREDGTAIFRLVAITASEQGRGHGRVLSRLVEERARAFGAQMLFVNAADTAVGYYEATGWRRHIWDERELVGIASSCIQMCKPIAQA
ncbi:MAG: GNAT family N-acetyltransferase [Alphaproteobacteria bacterium]|nr:GNAT family N-acetyltransferase [Alphaproteobacteria bacterium]MBU1559826.1 GNAT family N-acetyltransferase [Alphaproteobacteria bacterium]MBU2301021.1 GNAT family N-acetyltransferase [Alphaproteobacteria bacterium]MBU2368837.1 GNAT family N-acetyltransferase [Alphaproteobacteria bacterium]